MSKELQTNKPKRYKRVEVEELRDLLYKSWSYTADKVDDVLADYPDCVCWGTPRRNGIDYPDCDCGDAIKKVIVDGDLMCENGKLPDFDGILEVKGNLMSHDTEEENQVTYQTREE